jgi:hypothetical protein
MTVEACQKRESQRASSGLSWLDNTAVYDFRTQYSSGIAKSCKPRLPASGPSLGRKK